MTRFVSKLPPTDGNRVHLISDGELLFREFREAAHSSTKRVWVETFIIEKDAVGTGIVEMLSQAAARGCNVRLLFDQIGSPGFNLGFYQPILDAGGEVAIFNPLPFWKRRGRRVASYFGYRDHRKIFVADDIAYTGGHNLSEDYLGPAPRRFHDLSVRLEGPSVDDLAEVFADSFLMATGKRIEVERLARDSGGSTRVQIFGYDSLREMKGMDEALENAMQEAEHNCTFMLAYFMPDEWLCDLFISTARRGVTVQLLTIGHTDMPFVRWGGEHAYDSLLDAGVEIYQMEGQQLHAKTITFDGRLTIVGSYDFSSYQRDMNPEVGAAIWDESLAKRVEDEFRINLQRSNRIVPHEWRSRNRLGRILERASYHFLKR